MGDINEDATLDKLLYGDLKSIGKVGGLVELMVWLQPGKSYPQGKDKTSDQETLDESLRLVANNGKLKGLTTITVPIYVTYPKSPNTKAGNGRGTGVKWGRWYCTSPHLGRTDHGHYGVADQELPRCSIGMPWLRCDRRPLSNPVALFLNADSKWGFAALPGGNLWNEGPFLALFGFIPWLGPLRGFQPGTKIQRDSSAPGEDVNWRYIRSM